VFNITFALIGCAGFSMLVASHDPHVAYAGTFLGAIGIYPCISNTITWVSNNVEGVYKRGVSLGTVIAWGNLNGVMSSNIYRGEDAPYYRLGHSVVLGYLAVGLLFGSIFNYILLATGNARRARMTDEDRRTMFQDMSEEDQQRLADFHPDFKYTL
jgi:hypothetical protein